MDMEKQGEATHAHGGRPFRWTPQKERALQLEWEGRYRSAHQIAAAVGTTRRTIEGWRRRPAWKQRRQQEVDAWKAQWAAEQERERQEREARRAQIEAEMQAETDAWLAERRKVYERRAQRGQRR